ncbi:hypothetical protein [uncultured Cellulomonas sp.]|uniref:hypothetical protein n=1 Tax=uncultured Cellulomonas sp. TaxID=189682 RepID=UPI00262FFF70|nr:hypothetical protein [uncultured Cellulomonas sp.]
MRRTRTTSGLATAVTAALAAVVLAAGPAAASGRTILRDTFEGMFPLTDPVNASPVIAGVNPGGAPWVLDESSRVRVREDGRITLVVRHLVIPGRDPGNPAALMAASLVCDDAVVASTEAFPVSPEGNGHFMGRIAVPHHCDDPVVLVRNATNPAGLGAYFAVASED